MRWELADYSGHPIDGDATRVANLSGHLDAVADDIRSQIEQLRAINSGEFWESSAGSADSFQEVVEDLPEKLELVAVRYENVASALDTFHPVLADTRQDAEYWIQQAEAAEAEVERAQAGVQMMEEFETRAQQDAETANENRAEGDPAVRPEQWQGEDYQATLAAAQADLEAAIANCRSAVEDFRAAAQQCAEAIHEAGEDALENDSGFFSSVGNAISDAVDRLQEWALDVLEVVVDVLEWIAIGIGIALLVIALFIPGVNVGALVLLGVIVSGAILAGKTVLYVNGRAELWEVGLAAVGFAAAGLGGLAHLGRGLPSLARFAPALTNADEFLTGVGGGLAAFDLGGKTTEAAMGESTLLNEGPDVLAEGLDIGMDLTEETLDAAGDLDTDPGDLLGPLLPDPVGVPPVPGAWPGSDLTGLAGLAGLEAAYGPAQQSQTLDPGLVDALVPDGMDAPTVDVDLDLPAVSLPQTVQVASTQIPAGSG